MPGTCCEPQPGITKAGLELELFMSPRLSLRTAVLAAVAVGTVLVPSTAAFASDSPKPVAPKTEPSAAPSANKPKPAAPTAAPAARRAEAARR
ncbi:hypothetical protein G3I19_32915, partial [Streptomyces sp. SID10853]|nr:hypothetical protein [Streptomyces sp. SID10853]